MVVEKERKSVINVWSLVMSRYTGPRGKQSRAVGKDLGAFSGVRAIEKKCKFGSMPGMSGKRRSRPTDFGLQLQMKQTMKRTYGVLEKQFKNYFKAANSKTGATGDNLLLLLESRLDNIVFRAGFAATRAEARQLITHKHVLVNSNKVTIPSYQVAVEDVISLTESGGKQLRVGSAIKLAQEREMTDWLGVDYTSYTVVYQEYPDAALFQNEFKVNLVVEHYSK